MSITAPGIKPPSLKEIKARRKPIHAVKRKEELSVMERMAVVIADRVGTPGFFFIIIAWTIFWLGWNLLAPKHLQFDPPTAFVFWLFISNMLQIFLMPLIMVAQNLEGKHADRRAENDYEVNVKAEREVEAILHHLEYQNSLLIALVKKLGLTMEEIELGIAAGELAPDGNGKHEKPKG